MNNTNLSSSQFPKFRSDARREAHIKSEDSQVQPKKFHFGWLREEQEKSAEEDAQWLLAKTPQTPFTLYGIDPYKFESTTSDLHGPLANSSAVNEFVSSEPAPSEDDDRVDSGAAGQPSDSTSSTKQPSYRENWGCRRREQQVVNELDKRLCEPRDSLQKGNRSDFFSKTLEEQLEEIRKEMGFPTSLSSTEEVVPSVQNEPREPTPQTTAPCDTSGHPSGDKVQFPDFRRLISQQWC